MLKDELLGLPLGTMQLACISELTESLCCRLVVLPIGVLNSKTLANDLFDASSGEQICPV